MGRGVGPALGALRDDGADLVLAILVHPYRIGRRGDTARAHDLDAVRALAKLLPGRPDALVNAVGYLAEAVEDPARAHRVVARLLVDGPHVAVAAGHRQDLARIQESRSAHQAVGDGLGERVVAPADVAHGGETAVERVAEHAHRVRGAIRRPHGLDFEHVHIARVRVHVRVDEPRHERAAADVEDRRVAGGDRLVRDLADHAALDQDAHALGALGVVAVEEARVLEKQHCGHRSPWG